MNVCVNEDCRKALHDYQLNPNSLHVYQLCKDVTSQPHLVTTDLAVTPPPSICTTTNSKWRLQQQPDSFHTTFSLSFMSVKSRNKHLDVWSVFWSFTAGNVKKCILGAFSHVTAGIGGCSQQVRADFFVGLKTRKQNLRKNKRVQRTNETQTERHQRGKTAARTKRRRHINGSD